METCLTNNNKETPLHTQRTVYKQNIELLGEYLRIVSNITWMYQ